MNSYICPKCGYGFLEYKTTFVGGPELPYTENEIFCDRCGIHLNGSAVPKDKTQEELERLYQELKKEVKENRPG